MTEHEEVIVFTGKIRCRKCGSLNVKKAGKYNDKQYYRCLDCNSKFAGIDAYPDMKYPKEHVNRAITYYYSGMSLRAIQNTFQDIQKVHLPVSTIWEWIIKYSQKANKYALSLKPELSTTWIADETAIDIWGEQYWYWDIIDEKTRFFNSHPSIKNTNRKGCNKVILHG